MNDAAKTLFFLLLACLFSVMALSSLGGSAHAQERFAQPTIEELRGDWRDSIQPLLIGYLIDGDGARQRRQMEPFRLALERASGLQVSFHPVHTLDELIQLQGERRIHYGLHSASSYVALAAMCSCVEPVVVPTDQNATAGIRAVLLAPVDGKVEAVSDLKGRRLAVPAAPAVITRLLALHQLKDSGFGESTDTSTLIDVKNPVEGWRLVTAGKADAVIGWESFQDRDTADASSGTLTHLIHDTKLATRSDIRIIWRSDVVPNPPHVIRSDLPPPFKKLLRVFLINLHAQNRAAYDAISPFYSGGFIRVAEKDFAALTAIMQPNE